MTDRELNAAIGEKVMGWNLSEHVWMAGECAAWSRDKWSPSTDRNAAALVLERIGELRLVHEFDRAFERVYMADLIASFGPRWLGQFGRMQAPPRLLMEAALAAVGVLPENGAASTDNTQRDANTK